jgi:D-glycero-alpha-D-manno-heptose-7-phosphate kinase
VWEAFDSGEKQVTEALATMRDLVSPAAKAIEAANWQALAELVAQNWREQQQLHSTIAKGRTREIESAALAAGAWGMKATGAGAGGCIVILCPSASRMGVREAVTRVGGEVLDCTFSAHGVEVWEEEGLVSDA